MASDVLQDNPPNAERQNSRENLKRLFARWATEHRYNLVAAERIEEDIEIHGGLSFEAPFLGYIADPPPGTEWSPVIGETGQGILLATEVLPASIDNLRQTSYESGEFVESGGMLFGLHCIDLDGRPYSTAQIYVPLPKGAQASSGSIRFTASALGDIHRAVDRIKMQHGLKDLVATGWIHSHPGIAFESQWDTVAHRVGSGGGGNFYGIVVGNQLLQKGLQVGQDNVINLGQEIVDRQLHLITSNQQDGSIGLANRVAMAEAYFGKNTLDGAEIPYVIETVNSQPTIPQSGSCAMEIIDLTGLERETRSSGTVRIELVDRQEGTQGPDIVLTFDDLEELK